MDITQAQAPRANTAPPARKSSCFSKLFKFALVLAAIYLLLSVFLTKKLTSGTWQIESVKINDKTYTVSDIEYYDVDQYKLKLVFEKGGRLIVERAGMIEYGTWEKAFPLRYKIDSPGGSGVVWLLWDQLISNDKQNDRVLYFEIK